MNFNRSRACLCLLAGILGPFSAFSLEPVPGLPFSVPGSLGSFPFAVPGALFGDDPRAAAYNPASGANRELPVFGAAAALAFPTVRDSGSGTVASVSLSVPTSWATVNAVVDAAAASGSLRGFAVPGGSSGLLGISKAAGDSVSLGVSLGAAGLSGDSFKYGFSGAAGAEVDMPSFGPGGSKALLSVVAAGPSFFPWDDFGPVLSLTPLFATTTRIVDSDSFSFALSTLIAAPRFSDLFASAGASFGIGRFLNIDMGWQLSVRETARYVDGGDDAYLYAPRVFPSVSLLFDASSFLRIADYGAKPALSLRQAGGGVNLAESAILFSKGERDRTGPSVEVGPFNPAVVSKISRDEVQIPLTVTDSSRIARWAVSIFNQQGKAVFSRSGDADSKKNETAIGRLFSIKRGVDVPDAIRLSLVDLPDDGVYTVRAVATDMRGNEGRSSDVALTLDSVAPTARISVLGPLIFTPNADGVRDVLSLHQSGSAESEWRGSFVAVDGKIVRTYTWTQSEPLPFAWDGKGEDGQLVPDGAYTYRLSAVDDAGNGGDFSIAEIVVSGEPTPVAISMDGTALSPDGDGVFDSLRAVLQVPVKAGIDSWKIDVIGPDERVFRTWAGAAKKLNVFPDSVTFDGRDEYGNVITDGFCRFRVSVAYLNGNEPTALGDPFIVDTKKPSARARASVSFFSVGRGVVSFYQDVSPNAVWRGVVTDENENVVREFALPDSTENSVEWNGLDKDGNPVPDGKYRYEAVGRGPTGIVGRSPAVPFVVESGDVAASLIADKKIFSPIVSYVRFIPRYARNERPIGYTFAISVSGGISAYSVTGVSVPPTSFVWTGRDDSGKIVKDGEYVATLVVRYESGAVANSEPVPVMLDGTPPRASVVTDFKIFSPNGDGRLDSIRFRLDSSTEETWFGEIVDHKNRIVKSYRWQSRLPSELVWDGRRYDGVVSADGVYRLRLSSADAAGAEAKIESAAFSLDARKPVASVAVDKTSFSPNGDGFADTIKLRTVPSFNDGLGSFSFVILDSGDRVIRRFPKAKPNEEIVWDGKTDAGSFASDGAYHGRSELRYEKGDSVVSDSSSFVLDISAPETRIAIGPQPFSPDGDGENDTLNLDIRATDASGIASWNLTILDPEGYPFTQFSGKSIPSEPIAWDGTDLDGNLVEAAQDYSYTLVVRDTLGNATKTAGKILVDVFVLRDGDRLKIRVSSITFSPNAAMLVTSDAEATARNVRVLDRIATVLGKFPSYRIRVEGHAVNVSGSEREERAELQPLSLARAKAVVDALAERGIARERLEASGLGGREPVVPHGDAQFRWKNRRVEFILVR